MHEAGAAAAPACAPAAHVSIATVLGEASATLAAAGCETPRLDAELLLGEALGVGRERLAIDARVGLGERELQRFEALLKRRVAREPVAYILGRKAFCRIVVHVDRRVLIPRPESELLVDLGTALPAGSRVVDVGTGSGAVALALKHERPDLEVWATEVDADALEVARANARRLGLAVRFVQADLLAGVGQRFDAVLANLPYIADGAALQPEIAWYEPAGALFGGRDGLEVIRRLVPMVGDAALVALEVGADAGGERAAEAGGGHAEAGGEQAAEVAALLRCAGFRSIEVLRDLAGRKRVVVGRRGALGGG